jgi:hypothetical protein
MTKRQRAFVDLGFLMLAPLFGMGAIIVGGVGGMREDAGLFPAFTQGIEALNIVTLLLLLAIGFALGRLSLWNPVMLGLATVAPLPFIAMLEIKLDPTSHNLWPFEVILYSLLAVIPVVGAFIGWGVRKLRKPPAPAEAPETEP